MSTYIALVHKDEDSSFGVQFPDLPCCFSAADEMDDLVGNAAEALSLLGGRFSDADGAEYWGSCGRQIHF